MTQATATAVVHDLIGVGFGPSNIALAIALQERAQAQGALEVLFLDKQGDYRWHGNTLVSQSELQISFLKDLVSLRNPTSPYSFVNYLHKHDRLVDFINLGTFYPCRMEFNDYLRWVASHFQEQSRYGEEVLRIEPMLSAGQVEVRGDSHGVAAGERLLEERVLPMAAPGLLLGLPRPWTPAMLAGLPLLRSPLEPWQPWFRVAGLDWPEPCAGPRLLDLGMTLEAAANGQGVALARPSLARAWLAEGRLVVLFPLRSAPTHHYHLRSHQASPASQRFAAWLAAICREAVVQGREFLPAADD